VARLASSARWGLVGTLAFLVGYQGYRLLGNEGIGLAPALGVALVVGVAAFASTYALAGFLAARDGQA